MYYLSSSWNYICLFILIHLHVVRLQNPIPCVVHSECPPFGFCDSDKLCKYKRISGHWCRQKTECKSNMCSASASAHGKCLNCTKDADCRPENEYCDSGYCHKQVGYNEVCDSNKKCKSNVCGTSTVNNTCGCNAHSHCPIKHICNVYENTCKEKNCTAIQSFANGSVEYQNPSKRYDDKPVGFNDSLAVKCSPGYKSSTNETTCQLSDDNSTVSWTTIPLCYAVCSKLNKSANGMLLYQNSTLLYDDTQSSNVSKTVVQKCNVGFRLNGSNSATTCSQPYSNSRADWSPKLDRCKEAAKCQPLLLKENMQMSIETNNYDGLSSVEYSSTITITCDPDFDFIGKNQSITCNLNIDNTANWTSTSYACKPSTRPKTINTTPDSATQANKCEMPEVNRFTQMNFTTTTQYNGTMELEQHTVILVSCVKGYKLGGPGVVKCVGNNGSGGNAWNKTVRGCNEEWPWANFNHNLSWLGDYLIDERKKSDGSSTCLSFLSILLSFLAFSLSVVL